MMAEFQRLGWAAVLDSRHDTGTDLFLRPRDERRFEMGLVMGAQVKTGPKFFERTQKDEGGNVVGWWFAEPTRDHFDDWLSHAIPHIIVLRNQGEGRSYWAVISPQSVISTGRGAKILIPAENTVDQEHQEELVRAAGSRAGGNLLEGSAWLGQEVPSRDQIRYSLITPRLIAPHPNVGAVDLTPLQALASAVLLRPASDHFFLDDHLTMDARGRGLVAETPSLTEAQSSPSWGWRATAAVHEWLRNGDPRHLVQLPSSRDAGAESAASAVLQAVGHRELGQPDEAIASLSRVLARDEASPADHAWLQSHLATLLLDVGRKREAVDLAFQVLKAWRATPSDVTLGALAGSVTDLIFYAEGWLSLAADPSLQPSSGTRALTIGDVVSNSDTAAGWWWSQQLSWALSPTVDRLFEGWAPDTSVRFFMSLEPTERHLLTARALAALAANRDDWCQATGILAKYQLARGTATTTEQIAGLLTTLRLSGDSAAVKRAATRFAREGPVDALRHAASEIDLHRSTRTTISADLETLTSAGDLLEARHASKLVNWGLDLLQSGGPSDFLNRVQPSFDVRSRLVGLFTSLAQAADALSQRSLISYILERAPQADDFEGASLARLLHAIPDEAWSGDQRGLAREVRMESPGALSLAVQRLLTSEDDDVRRNLLERARHGDINALEGIDDIRSLPPDATAGLIRALQSRVLELINNARRGVRSFGGIEVVGALTLLNIWHPEEAKWDEVVLAFTEPRVGGSDLNQALSLIASSANRINAETRTRLVEPCRALLEKAPAILSFDPNDDIRGRAFEALLALGGQAPVADVVYGSPEQRASIARAIGSNDDEAALPLLSLLASDHSVAVRAAAANSLCGCILRGRGGEAAAKRLLQLLHSDGVVVATAVTRAVLDAEVIPPEFSWLVELLEESPFARIRTAMGRWKRSDFANH